MRHEQTVFLPQRRRRFAQRSGASRRRESACGPRAPPPRFAPLPMGEEKQARPHAFPQTSKICTNGRLAEMYARARISWETSNVSVDHCTGRRYGGYAESIVHAAPAQISNPNDAATWTASVDLATYLPCSRWRRNPDGCGDARHASTSARGAYHLTLELSPVCRQRPCFRGNSWAGRSASSHHDFAIVTHESRTD